MGDLYERLGSVGYDPTFVRECVLPDWWSDDLATVPANRAIAEMALARHFGFRIADLRDHARSLTLPCSGNIRLKRTARATEQDVAPATCVARRAAELVAESVMDLPDFDGASLASAAREAILRNHAHVDLGSLLAYCWSHGIAVLHLSRTPRASKKIAGLATFCAHRPVIVLASGRDSPPWLAFHLAHELGHIMRKHVHEGGDPVVDQNLDRKDEDHQEQEADRFACELLTGEPSPGFAHAYGLTAERLAQAALQYGESRRISPGTVVLIYGRSAKRFPAAQRALHFLGQDVGAHEQITRALRQVLPADDLPETTKRFLSGCIGPWD
jgi:Zn-dependent peptidase ImmA (M78 family)